MLNPRDLLDEVREQLVQLRTTMQIRIWNSISELDYQERDFFKHRDNVFQESTVALQQKYESLLGQITASKILAETANINVSSCVDEPEEALFNLQKQITSNFWMCEWDANQESRKIVVETTYNTDILINHVEVFEFQIESCRGNFICIQPILTQIQLAIVTYPLKIDEELESSQNLFDQLKVFITKCDAIELAKITGEGDNIVENAIDCVNRLLPLTS